MFRDFVRVFLLMCFVAVVSLGGSGISMSANAQAFKDAGNATDVINPHAPRYNHPYRRGAIPTTEILAKMKSWALANNPVAAFLRSGKRDNEYAAHIKATSGSGAATGTRTLSYMGGVDSIGVTSGKPKVYLVFWGTQWGTASTVNGYMTFSGDSKSAAPYMQKWIKGLGTNNELWSGVLTQYCDGPLVPYGATSCPTGAPHIGYPTGDALAGVWYDNSAAAPTAATGNQIAQEAVLAAAYFGNTTPDSNRYAQYVIMSPSGTKPDGFNTPSGGFCAWHDWNGDTTLSGGGAAASPYGDIAFTNMPYVADLGASCGGNFVSGPLDGFSIVGGHEYAETVTDQNPAGGWINNTGSAYNGYENGDECAWISSGQGAAGLVSMSTGSFAMQSSWSNDTNRCDLSHPIISGTGGIPVANFSVNTTGLVASFTDQSTDPGGAIGIYAWTFGDGSTSGNANPTHNYATAGTYTVTETVTDLVNGATNTTSAQVTVAQTGGTPNANFTYSTNGFTVTFRDGSTDVGGTISTRSWTFGDNTVGSGTTPSHTYAAAGSYSVSETVTDSINGKTSTATQTVQVTPPSNLIVNGGFESGATTTPWLLSPGVICGSSTCSGETANSGSWYAWLDGYGKSHIDTADQIVSLPGNKSAATLSFYLHIDTQEYRTVARDTLKVQLLNPNTGNVLGTLATYSNINAASGFSLKTLNLNGYIGRTLKLRFLGSEDNSLATSFIIDDVKLTVQ